MILANVVADSTNPQGDRLTSLLVTFPRIILAEVNTHRMLSKNTSSSRAIPFNKMVEAVQNNPFIPIAWQKDHKGMQGSEYHISENNIEDLIEEWLYARNVAVTQAELLNEMDITKQLCNRLLEPFMWTTMLITGSKEGWDNFFNLRCPQYEVPYTWDEKTKIFRSIKDATKYWQDKADKDKTIGQPKEKSEIEWLQLNKGQAEIHMMQLAECIWDAMNESTPKELKAGEWHIPFNDKIDDIKVEELSWKQKWEYNDINAELYKVKISTAMAARTSYTVVGDEKEIIYDKLIELHDKLINQNPLHASPMEHCARVMSDDEYQGYVKGKQSKSAVAMYAGIDIQGWCRNFKGFIQYRHLLEK